MKRSRQSAVRGRLYWRMFAMSLIVGLLLSMTSPGEAGAVHGRVTLNDTPVQDTEITLSDASGRVTIRIRTDSQGNYAAVLAPGIYTVTMGQHTATVRSYLGRTRQDINFSGE